MMDRYFKPPQIKGRPLKPLSFTKGKRHFWGEKGKNYGFFTTPEENDMDVKRRQHRRIKSEAYDYINDKSVRYGSQFDSKRTIPTGYTDHSLESYRKKVEKAYATIGVQSDDNLLERKDVGVEVELTLREQMHHCLQKPKKERIIEQTRREQVDEKCRLPEIKYKSESLKTQEKEQQKRPSVKFLDETHIMSEQPQEKSKKKETVVYYIRKSRLNNPTFCNSFAYPLPCHRYVA